MAPPEIRVMRAEDLDEKVDVHVRAWFETYAGLLPDEWNRENITSKKIRAFQLRRGFDRTLVLRERGGLVGFASYEPEARAFLGRPGASEVSSIYVLRACQGRGLGRALMEAALARCPHDDVSLMVLDGNRRAIGFYEHLGFSLTGARFADGPMCDLEMLLRRGRGSD